MNSTNLIYLGAIISAIGSILVVVGNVGLTKDIDRKQSAQLTQSVEKIVSHFKTVNKEQIEGVAQVAKSLVDEQRVALIIQDLTLPEKWVLLRFIKGYQALRKEDMQRMFSELNDYYSKTPFKNNEDPFYILIRKKLITSKNINSGVSEQELTPLGLRVVTLLTRNKISPFDIIREY